jgi:hypothetical protein
MNSFAILSPTEWLLLEANGLIWTQDQAEIPVDMLKLLIIRWFSWLDEKASCGFESRFPLHKNITTSGS